MQSNTLSTFSFYPSQGSKETRELLRRQRNSSVRDRGHLAGRRGLRPRTRRSSVGKCRHGAARADRGSWIGKSMITPAGVDPTNAIVVSAAVVEPDIAAFAGMATGC